MPPSKPFKSPTTVNLTHGDSGPEVRELQEYLEHFGYLRWIASDPQAPETLQAISDLPQAEPELFDDATLEALHNYQQFLGLPISDRLDEATAVEMSLPRCGVPDQAQVAGLGDFVAAGNRWPKTDLTYGFQEFTAELTPQQIRSAIASAFRLWSQVTPLRFQEVAITSNPDIIIRFVLGNHNDGTPFDGVGNVLAHAFSPPPNGGSLAGDTHFDDAETWSVTIPATGTDLVTVAAHEFGHALGLAHSPVRGALMAPTYRGPQRFLTQDDMDGIQSIYGASATTPFTDVTRDIYRQEILDAVALRFISGFANRTFRPQDLLTREQLVSMSLEALKTLSGVTLPIPTQVSEKPFPDVGTARWSAPKIAFANANRIVNGYADGTFRPTLTVTRAEMMAVLRRTAEFAKSQLGFNPLLTRKQTPFIFSDITRHWAEDVIRQMSGYGGVASPLNEQGRAFFPNQPAQRNYGAAATLRMLNCVRAEST
ncbi:MAG: matrixin family metalloprotease [Thermosynechococcaceae cyanobacterium]